MNSLRKFQSAPSVRQSGFRINFTSPPHPEVNPQPNAHHASSSNHQLQVTIGLEHNSTPPLATAGAADDRPWETTLDVNNLTLEVDKIIDILRSRIILYQAALMGEWQEAESVLNKYPYLLRESITRDNEIALHIAAGAKNTAFVEKLVDLMDSDDMAKRNKDKNTPFCFAAASGVVRIAELMVKKNKDLPLIRGFDNTTPLFMAVSYKHREMASYLWSITDIKQLNSKEQSELLIAAIHSDFYDICWKIYNESGPKITIMEDAYNETALHVIARKPSACGRKKQLNIWEQFIDSGIKGTYSKDVSNTLFARALDYILWELVLLDRPIHLQRLLHDAARAGNVEFLILIINTHPHTVWECDDDGKSIFHIAIENRLENVFNLIHEVVGLKEFSSKFKSVVKGKYNLLHLVAKLPAPNILNGVSGAALQMQRELLWFKEVEKIVLPSQLEAQCDDELTPRELFRKEHKDLRKDGEQWMKNTANSCMLVATLIATIVFAAAFTVPGGSDNNTGIPIFQRKLWFNVFVIMDAVALVSSSTSILMFMSILTSRYPEEDFLHSLPSRLLFGLASLFISIVCMVVAFSATCFMLYYKVNIQVPATIAAIAMVPVSCFCVLQFKLWVDIFHNTYLSRFLFKCGPHKLPKHVISELGP